MIRRWRLGDSHRTGDQEEGVDAEHDPFEVVPRVADGVEPPHERAHAGARDDVDGDAFLFEHLEDAVEALEIDLSASDMAYLEEPYEPVSVSGHQ